MGSEGFAGLSAAPVGTGTDSAATSVKLSFDRGSIKYDNPFMDMTSLYIPVSIKGMFRFIANFVLSDGLLSQCVVKMAEYPITKLIYSDDDSSEKKGIIKDDQSEEWWKSVLEEQLKFMHLARECGMNYYSYGNSYISIHFPYSRQLECKHCGAKHAAESLKDLKFKNWKFIAKCPKCKKTDVVIANDVATKDISRLRVIRWDITNVDVKYNNISDEHFYYYTIPANIKNALKNGDMDIVNSTRLQVIEAAQQNKQVKLSPDNLYHMKRSSPQYIIPTERGYGIPLVLPVMRDIFHIRVLKKANEMISFDHIVPMRMLFPSSTGDVSPHLTTSLDTWRSKVETELLLWKRDPNRVSLVPMPIGQASFGGDARLLMVTPEIKAAEDDIIIGMGIIPEIIKGGASWSGSNVSLRIVENSFINHRNDIHGLLDFIKKKVAIYFGKPNIDCHMSDFKMADDLTKKQIMLSNAGTVDSLFSGETAIKEFGFDPAKEAKNKEKELKDRIELKTREAEGMAEAQGAGSIISALFQADAQMEQQKRVDMHNKNINKETSEENNKARNQATEGISQDLDQQKMVQVDPAQLILILTQRFARLASSDPEEFKIRLFAMKQSMPHMFDEVYRNLKELNLMDADLLTKLKPNRDTGDINVQPAQMGDVSADEQPATTEAVASVDAATAAMEMPAITPKPLPEQRPPRNDPRI